MGDSLEGKEKMKVRKSEREKVVNSSVTSKEIPSGNPKELEGLKRLKVHLSIIEFHEALPNSLYSIHP